MEGYQIIKALRAALERCALHGTVFGQIFVLPRDSAMAAPTRTLSAMPRSSG